MHPMTGKEKELPRRYSQQFGEQNDVTDDSSDSLQSKNRRKMKEMMLFQHVTSCGLYRVLTGWSELEDRNGRRVASRVLFKVLPEDQVTEALKAKSEAALEETLSRLW